MGLNMTWEFILQCVFIASEHIYLFSLDYQEAFKDFGGENPRKACRKACK